MAETSEQPEQHVDISKIDAKPKASPTPAAPRSRSTGGLGFGIIMLLILGLAGGGFYLFSQLRDKQEGLGGEVRTELTRQINDYQKQLTAIQSQVAALQSEIAGKEDHFNKALADFSELHGQKMEATRKEISDKVLQVQRQLGKTRGDWLIADAEYLLSVANERLHLVGDINTTREALEAADQRLRESGDAGTISIREQIAKEIAQLQGIKPVDIVGLHAAIQTLQSEVPKLTLLLPYSGKPPTPPGERNESAPVSEDPNDLLSGAIRELEGVVTIKRTDQPIKEILSQEQAEFIREQLKVKLELLKVALVQQNDGLYQSILTEIKSWVTQHFTDNDATKSFVSEVGRLQAIKLRNQLPDISGSLKMLRDVAKLRVESDKALTTDEEAKPNQDNNPTAPANTSKPEAKSTETNSSPDSGKSAPRSESKKQP